MIHEDALEWGEPERLPLLLWTNGRLQRRFVLFPAPRRTSIVSRREMLARSRLRIEERCCCCAPLLLALSFRVPRSVAPAPPARASSSSQLSSSHPNRAAEARSACPHDNGTVTWALHKGQGVSGRERGSGRPLPAAARCSTSSCNPPNHQSLTGLVSICSKLRSGRQDGREGLAWGRTVACSRGPWRPSSPPG